MIWKLLLPLVLAFGAQAVIFLLLQQPVWGVGGRVSSYPAHRVSDALASGPPWCVNPGGTGGCYSRIQDAIDAASSGTVIDVDAGTYTEYITMRDGISIYGRGWSTTTIHGGYSGPTPTVYMSSIWAGTVLSGVQVTGGGTGVITTSTQDGGCIAIWYAAPTIINTLVNGCTARNGGGVFVRNSSPTFDNVPAWLNEVQQRGGGYYIDGTGQVTVTDSSLFADTNGTVLFNTAGWDGGGLYISGVTATVVGLRVWLNTANGNGGGVEINNAPNQVFFVLNQINLNSASNGGGVNAYNATQLLLGLNGVDGNTVKYSGGGAQFSDSAGLFQSNLLRTNTAGAYGGGLSVLHGSPDLIVRGNWIEDNTAGFGAGVYLQTTAAPWIDGNIIVTNTSNTAAGIGLNQAGVTTITNNILVHNVASTTAHLAGGILVDSSPARIVNNTIADNIGDGILFQAAEGVAIVNNIVSGNLGHGIEHYSDTLWVSPTLAYTTDYNDVLNNSDGHYTGLGGGVHDLHVNPQFVGMGIDLRDFYHIQATSRVTGSTTWAPEYDLDSDRRILGGSVSMGADEIAIVEHRTYLPVVLRD
jgi:parallel beta-helix repeat protein